MLEITPYNEGEWRELVSHYPEDQAGISPPHHPKGAAIDGTENR